MRKIFLATFIGLYFLGAPAFANDSFTDVLQRGDLKGLSKILNKQSAKERIALQSKTLPNGDLPIIHAAKTGNLELFDLLIRFGADPNARATNGRDVLNIAVRTGNTALARRALAAGTDPKAFTLRFQGSTLIFASDRGEVEIVKLLIEAGAPLDRVNTLGWTALLEAVVLGDGGTKHRNIVAMLLEAGADQTIGDKDGVTPLEHAISRGHKKMASLLRRHL